MDATQLFSKKFVILVTLALLVAAASSPAQAQQSFTAPTNVTVPGLGTGVASLSVATSDGTAQTFKAAISYSSGSSQWLTFGNGGCTTSVNGTTAASGNPATTLTLAVGCQAAGVGQLLPATITITGTGASAGYTGATTIASAGSSTGTITASGAPGGTNSLSLSAPSGSSTTGSITLSTTSASPISFNTTTLNPGSWLTSVTQTSGTVGSVSASSNAVLTVAANAAGLSASPSPATIQINYNNTTLNVVVSFNVGNTGSGTLTLSQTSVPWAYTTNGTLPGPNYITVTSPNGAQFYSATITNITGGYSWLTIGINGITSTSSISLQGIGNLLSLQGNSSMASLNTGSYTATVQATDSSGNTGYIYVTLSVNGGGGTGALSLSPASINFSAAYLSTSLASGSATLTSTVTGNVSATVSGTGLQSSVTLSSSVVAAGGQVQITVYGYASNLSPSTYPGTLSVTVGSTTQNFPVYFTVGSGTGSTGANLAPSSLQFVYQTDGNQGAPPVQSLMIGGTSSYSITLTNNTSGSNTWFTVSPVSGTAPAQVFVTVTPTGLATGAYSGTITVSTGGATLTSTVNLTVMTGTPMVYASPGVVIFNQPSTTTPSSSVYLYSTNGTALSVTVTTSTSWLSFISAVPTLTQTSFAIQANTAGLANGINQGTITVTSGTTSLSIPVIVYLTNGTGTGSGNLTFSVNPVVLSSAAGATSAATAYLGVNSSSTTYFTATVSPGNCTQTSWLSLSSYAAYTYTLLTVSANPAGLPAGTCMGSITFNGTQTVPVNFTIGGGAITLSPTTPLSFAYSSGGTVPASQTVTVSTTSTSSVSFSAAITGSNCGWVGVSPASGNTVSGTPVNLSVSLNSFGLSGLTAGSYSCTLAVTPTGGTASNLTLNLTVSTPTISASPTTLTFAYQAGGAVPAAQTVAVSGGGFTASATSTGSWLSVTPTSSTTAASLSVSVSPSSLTAGSYTGTIMVTGASGATGSATVNVTLTVTAPLPTVTAVVNGASFATGPVSPGEVISIGGTAIGPASPAFLTLDANGNVATTIGGVTVTIGGFAAPLVYASSSQINAIVPYQVAGQIAPTVVVKYLGQTSNGYALQTTVAAPGIFTQSSQGTGPGAILNQNYTVNGPTTPAAKNSIVQVFMTGEGVTTPTAVTGKVNNVTSASQLPVPLLSVSASVGGVPAQVVFAAEAPNTVSGVLQVNLVIPSTVASGPNAIVINIGTAPSQNGVTVTVQ